MPFPTRRSCHPATALLLSALLWLQVSGLRLRGDDHSFEQVLWNYEDVQYYGNLTVGGQTVNAVYDTGSFELLVLSSSCQHCGDTKGFYRSGGSSSHMYGNMSVMHTFGSGTLYSKEAYETVSNGPLKGDQVPFWEVYDANMPVLENSKIESIAGLSPFPSNFLQMALHSSRNEEAFASIQSALNITSFALCLGKDPRSDGYLTWNEKSHRKELSESFSEVKLTLDEVNPHWTAKLESVSLGNDELACENGCAGVVDSGTSLLAVPREVAEKLKTMVANLRSDCSDLSSLPYLSFKLGGVDLSLPPDSYVYQTPGDHGSAAGCKALIMTLDLPPSEELGDMWILGMPFLRKYFTIFEAHPARLFVAEADTNCRPRSLEAANDEALEGVTRRSIIRPRSIDVKSVRWPSWMRRSVHSPAPPHWQLSELHGVNASDDGSLIANHTSDLLDIFQFGYNASEGESEGMQMMDEEREGGIVVEVPLNSELQIDSRT